MAVITITFGKPSYAPGETVTATVEGDWEQADQVTITDPEGGTGTGSITVTEPVTATDPAWKLVSSTGTLAVFTATASVGMAALTVTAGTATATAAPHVLAAAPCLYGVNAHVYTTVTPALTGISFVKIFNYDPGVPASWPGPPAGQNQPVPPGAQALVCFMPPLAALLAGSLDAQLKAWLAQAPAGSWVTAYQESNDPANGFWQQAGASQGSLLAMHTYLNDFCAANAPHVSYGADIGSSPIYGSGQDCTAWVPAGLGWYSFDGYDRPTKNSAGEWVSKYTAAEVFAGIGQVKAKWPGARVAITETNTYRVTQDPASAGAWFTAAYAVACQYGCSVFSTWWGPPATTNADWKLIEFTAGAPYVTALNAIAADCAA